MSFFGITVFGAQNAFRRNWKINNLIDLFTIEEYLSGFDRVVDGDEADIKLLTDILEKTWLGPAPADSEARAQKAFEGLEKFTRAQFENVMTKLIAEDRERKKNSDLNPVGYTSSTKMREDRRNFKSKERPVADVYAKVSVDCFYCGVPNRVIDAVGKTL